MRPAALLAAMLILAHAGPALAQKEKDKVKKPAPRPEVAVGGKTIAQWAAVLKDGKTADKFAALSALMDAGPEARAAVPALIGVFRNKDESLIHPLAASALARVGPDAVGPLEKALLEDKEPLVRGLAGMALSGLGPLARAAVPALTKALDDKDAFVREMAAEALGSQGAAARAALPALRKGLDDKEAPVRLAAAAALAKVGGEARGAAALAALLKGPLAERAARALGEIGPQAKAAADELRAALKHAELPVRLAAAAALYRVTGEASLGVFAAALKDRKPEVRQEATAALAALAAEPKAVALLVDQLSAAEADLRREAACALAARGAALDAAARKALQARLKDADLSARWWAALALAASGADVRKDEEELFAALRAPLVRAGDREPASAQVREALGAARGVPALLAVLGGGTARLKVEAARQLALLGLDVRPAVAELAAALKTDDKPTRRYLAEALGRTGVEGLGVLTKLLDDPDARLREAAARALGFMGVAARSAAPALQRRLKDPESTVRAQAAQALWFVEANTAQALPILLLVIKDVDNKDRWEAFEGVGVIAVTARPPIKGLTEIVFDGLKDRDARVRATAAKWLWRRFKEPTRVVPLLSAAVTDRDALVRQVAVEALGEMSPDAKAMALLVTALEDRELAVRQAAVEGLARGGAKALPALREAAKGKSARAAAGARRAIELIGSGAGK